MFLLVLAVLATIPHLRRQTAYQKTMTQWAAEIANFLGQPLVISFSANCNLTVHPSGFAMIGDIDKPLI